MKISGEACTDRVKYSGQDHENEDRGVFQKNIRRFFAAPQIMKHTLIRSAVFSPKF